MRAAWQKLDGFPEQTCAGEQPALPGVDWPVYDLGDDGAPMLPEAP